MNEIHTFRRLQFSVTGLAEHMGSEGFRPHLIFINKLRLFQIEGGGNVCNFGFLVKGTIQEGQLAHFTIETLLHSQTNQRNSNF